MSFFGEEVTENTGKLKSNFSKRDAQRDVVFLHQQLLDLSLLNKDQIQRTLEAVNSFDKDRLKLLCAILLNQTREWKRRLTSPRRESSVA